MQFIYGKAPIAFNDGIPSHKAGEWPGIKPCKFHSYKRVIRPVNCGIIFNEKEPLAPPRRRLLGPKGPSPEFVFRSSSRFIPAPGSGREARKEGIRYIPPFIHEESRKQGRRHYFGYISDMNKEKEEKERNMTTAKAVKNEFRLMSLIGFAKKPYEGISNAQLNTFHFTKGIKGLKINEEPDFFNMTKTQRMAYRRNKTVEDNINRMQDVNYVERLDGWEQKFQEKNKVKNIPNNMTNIDNDNSNNNKEIITESHPNKKNA